MAAVASEPLVNITINDIPIQVPKGELIVESVKRVGLEIPIFCYHPRMKPVGMCRMCLVEIGTKGPDGSVRMMPKPQAACSLPASEGLVIVTDTEKIHADRRGVLEFLLINHPLDCPICDRGGECPLQNNTLAYGPSTSRYVEIKRHAPKAFPLSKYVTLDLERCIQCGRCVRFTEEISGDAQLAFRFRGANMQPSTFDMTDFESKFSGNVIEICPVGALTNAKYRFRARPWDLQTRPGICTNCSNGCNVHFDYRGDKVVRINGRTNEAVNEEWTCDKGKFGHDFYNGDKRLGTVLVRKGDRLVAGDWADAYAQIIQAFSGRKSTEIAVLAGTRASNEDLYLLNRLFRRDLGSTQVAHRFEAAALPVSDAAPTTIAAYELAPSVLVFGTSLADELPILHLRIRKAWLNGQSKIVVAHHEATEVESFAAVTLRYKKGTEATLAAGLLAQLVREGKVSVSPSTRESLEGFTLSKVCAETGVAESSLVEAATLIAGAPIVTTRGLLECESGLDAANYLAEIAKTTEGKFNSYARTANEEGAALLGLDSQTSAHEILTAAANGSVKALWLAGLNPFDTHADRDLVTRALENVEFLIVQDFAETEALAFASVVLPQAAPAEADGSYTNLERRVQRFRQVLPTKGDAKAAWRIYSEVSLRLKPATPYFHPSDVLEAIAKEVPAFAGCSYAQLEGEGFVLGAKPEPEGEIPASEAASV